MVRTGQPMRPFWVRWWRGGGGRGGAAWLDGVVVELNRCGLLFLSKLFFLPPCYYFNYGHPAKQASLHGL